MLGVVTPIGDQGADIARTAALAAGLPDTVAGVQLNRFCASGLEAVNIAAQKVRSGWEDLVLAGGVESMSRVPMGSDGGAWAMDPETNFDTGFVPQGIGADLIATHRGLHAATDVDAYAARVADRAPPRRGRTGAFDRSVVPVRDRNGLVVLDRDEHIRARAPRWRRSARCEPSFAAIGEMGGFDAVALQQLPLGRADRPRAPRRQLLGHRGRRRAGAGRQRGGRRGRRADARGPGSSRPPSPAPSRRSCSPGPRPPARKALAKAGLTVDDIDLFEINEAFAAVALRFMRDLGVAPDKVNVNGGAIAMGHPLGATGAMLLGTLLDELERRQLRYGLATLCVGGGMGIATIIERL